MQTLWRIGLNWDDQLPDELASQWKLFSSELPLVSKIKLPRHISIYTIHAAQLLGFSDASEKGYAVVIYLRIVHVDRHISVHFVTAKSKVAPLKLGKLDGALTIPRLELCGALLLAQTFNRVHNIISNVIPNLEDHAWTYSTVVLTWLTAPQESFKIFVSNRLAKIAELLPICNWHYIPSVQNPADCVSRGMFPSLAIKYDLYWKGPSFLYSNENAWPLNIMSPIPISALPDFKINVSVLTNTYIYNDCDWLSRFSSLLRMQRVLAYVRRFINRARKRSFVLGPITTNELDVSMLFVIRVTQRTYFSDVIRALKFNTNLPSKGIARLTPFMDDHGIIRVGGRLQNSNRSFEQRSPVLLPKKCLLTTLIIRHFHFKFKHAGPQLLASLIAHQYWILSSRSVIRLTIFKCVVCARHKAITTKPIMAPLPSFRVRPARPFEQVGIDFAGPFWTKEGRRKNSRTVKTYLAVFVCMVIKAAHLEIVCDLSTDAFLASFERFVARR